MYFLCIVYIYIIYICKFSVYIYDVRISIHVLLVLHVKKNVPKKKVMNQRPIHPSFIPTDGKVTTVKASCYDESTCFTCNCCGTLDH